MVWKSNFLSPAEEAARPKHSDEVQMPTRATPVTSRKSRTTPLTVEEQRSSSNRLSRSTPSTNQEPGVTRQTQPPRPSSARPVPAPAPAPTTTVQLSSVAHSQRSNISAHAAALHALPDPPQMQSSASTLPPPPSGSTAGTNKGSIDRSALPEGLVETMDHIVGQVIMSHDCMECMYT